MRLLGVSVTLLSTLAACGDDASPGGSNNRSPVADFEVIGELTVGRSVILDARASADPDGDPITFRWTTDVKAEIDDVTNSRTHLTLNAFDSSGRIEVELMVFDGLRTHSVSQALPIETPEFFVDAGPDQRAYPGQLFRFDATLPDDDAMRPWHSWTQISGPTVELRSCVDGLGYHVFPCRWGLAPETSATLEFKLEAGWNNLEASDTVRVQVSADPWVIDLGPDLQVNQGEWVRLSAARPRGYDARLSWSKPDGSLVPLPQDDVSFAAFRASMPPGVYEVTLTASADDRMVEDTVSIEILPYSGPSELLPADRFPFGAGHRVTSHRFEHLVSHDSMLLASGSNDDDVDLSLFAVLPYGSLTLVGSAEVGGVVGRPAFDSGGIYTINQSGQLIVLETSATAGTLNLLATHTPPTGEVYLAVEAQGETLYVVSSLATVNAMDSRPIVLNRFTMTSPGKIALEESRKLDDVRHRLTPWLSLIEEGMEVGFSPYSVTLFDVSQEGFVELPGYRIKGLTSFREQRIDRCRHDERYFHALGRAGLGIFDHDSAEITELAVGGYTHTCTVAGDRVWLGIENERIHSVSADVEGQPRLKDVSPRYDTLIRQGDRVVALGPGSTTTFDISRRGLAQGVGRGGRGRLLGTVGDYSLYRDRLGDDVTIVGADDQFIQTIELCNARSGPALHRNQIYATCGDQQPFEFVRFDVSDPPNLARDVVFAKFPAPREFIIDRDRVYGIGASNRLRVGSLVDAESEELASSALGSIPGRASLLGVHTDYVYTQTLYSPTVLFALPTDR
ncbi:MAG: hypothetical protein AAFP04_08790, partial [Myxococcota bacterium]